MVGMFSALIGATIYLICATFLSLPVSSTHSMGTHYINSNLHLPLSPKVGAVVGFTIMGAGWESVDWSRLGLIALSWVTSPLLCT